MQVSSLWYVILKSQLQDVVKLRDRKVHNTVQYMTDGAAAAGAASVMVGWQPVSSLPSMLTS